MEVLWNVRRFEHLKLETWRWQEGERYVKVPKHDRASCPLNQIREDILEELIASASGSFPYSLMAQGFGVHMLAFAVD
jgi:hypothetical protein